MSIYQNKCDISNFDSYVNTKYIFVSIQEKMGNFGEQEPWNMYPP